MKLNLTVTINVPCKKCEKEKHGEIDNTELELVLNILDCSNFLFKFGSNTFKLGDYKAYIMPDPMTGKIKSISFLDDDYVYVVRDKNLFLGEVLAGYEKMRMLEKLSSIAEFTECQSSAPTSDEILDEFDDNVDMNE